MTDKVDLTIEIIRALLKYGPSAVRTIAGAFDDNYPDPTPEQIRELMIDKDPEEFFR